MHEYESEDPYYEDEESAQFGELVDSNENQHEEQQTENYEEPENIYEAGRVYSYAPQKTVGQEVVNLARTVEGGEAIEIVNALEEFSKSQIVRFLDFSFIGPVLMYYAYKGKLSKSERALLALIGVGTTVYNFRNFYNKQKKFAGGVIADAKEILQEKI